MPLGSAGLVKRDWGESPWERGERLGQPPRCLIEGESGHWGKLTSCSELENWGGGSRRRRLIITGVRRSDIQGTRLWISTRGRIPGIENAGEVTVY